MSKVLVNYSCMAWKCAMHPKRTALRKFIRTACASLLAVVFVMVGQAQTTKPNPIIGRWLWFNQEEKIFNSDGTVSGEGAHGRWRQIGNVPFEPKYEVVWEKKYVDTVSMKNGKLLEGKNQKGEKVSAHRAGKPQ